MQVALRTIVAAKSDIFYAYGPESRHFARTACASLS